MEWRTACIFTQYTKRPTILFRNACKHLSRELILRHGVLRAELQYLDCSKSRRREGAPHDVREIRVGGRRERSELGVPAGQDCAQIGGWRDVPIRRRGSAETLGSQSGSLPAGHSIDKIIADEDRSEERRVGKECRSRWW